MPSARAVFPVVTLVLAAGCLGPTAGTPASTEGTPASTPVDADLPPGVNQSGLVDADRLLEAHGAGLDRADASRVHATRLVVREDGETVRSMNRTVHRATVRGWEVLRVRETARHGTKPFELYKRGPAVVRKTVRAGHENGSSGYYEYRYEATGNGYVEVGDPVDGPVVVAKVVPSEVLSFALAAGDFRVTNASDGVVTLVATGPTSDGNLSEVVVEYSATVTVTTDGVVRRLEGEMTQSDETRARHMEFSYEADLGVEPPSKPRWTSEVPQLALTLNGDGTVLAVEHRAGPALPEGTSLSVHVTGPDGPVDADLALPERLEGNATGGADASYVYAVRTGDGVDLRISAERPATNESFVDLARGDALVSSDAGHVSFELRLEPDEDE